MGSVIDNIECPNCKHEAFSDFYYKTGEEYVGCNNCGYHRSAFYKRDDNGKLVTKDGSDDYKFENLIMEFSELKDPYGAYRIKVYHNSGFQCGSFLNKEEYDYFYSEIFKDVEIEFCSVSMLTNGEIVTEVIIDNGPKVDSSGFTIEER